MKGEANWYLYDSNASSRKICHISDLLNFIKIFYNYSRFVLGEMSPRFFALYKMCIIIVNSIFLALYPYIYGTDIDFSGVGLETGVTVWP